MPLQDRRRHDASGLTVHPPRCDIVVHPPRDGCTFSLRNLSEASAGFSGAEIDQAVVSALYVAHGPYPPTSNRFQHHHGIG